MPRQARNSTSSTNSTQSNDIAYHVLTPNTWKPELHVFSKVKPNKSGQGKTVPLSYEGKRFYVKTPKMYCPFGASFPKPKPGESVPLVPSWSLQMALGDSQECQDFLNQIQNFDDIVIDMGSETSNSVAWLGGSKSKPMSREVVESKYTTMLKYPTTKDGDINGDYPPFIRVKIPTPWVKDGDSSPSTFQCEIYDNNNNLLDVSPRTGDPNCINTVIRPGSYCSALIYATNVWCNNSTGFGVSWKIQQLKVFPPKGIPRGNCLLDDPEDEEEDHKSVEGQNFLADDDDDEVIEVEEVVEEEDTQPTRRRVQMRRQ